VLLTDGSANAGTGADGSSICPRSTWNPQVTPLCRDSSSSTRHCAISDTHLRCIQNGNGAPYTFDPNDPFDPNLVPGGYPFVYGSWDLTNYDADDYARDMADFVGIDQNALLFAIGLGNQVNSPSSDPAGERLLRYASKDGIGNGLYFFAPSTIQLTNIFKKIGDNIAVRLAR